MAKYKLLKFLGERYPYVNIKIFDQNLNRSVNVKVGTTELDEAINKALLSGDKEKVNRAQELDRDMEAFLPSSMILNGDDEEISECVKAKKSLQ